MPAPSLATPPAPIAKEKLKESAKEAARPAAIQEAVGGASNSSPNHVLLPGRKGALEKGNVTRAYFGEDASMYDIPIPNPIPNPNPNPNPIPNPNPNPNPIPIPIPIPIPNVITDGMLLFHILLICLFSIWSKVIIAL